MSKRACYTCGADPAAGFASIWSPEDGERWYCHGDDDETPTCYQRASGGTAGGDLLRWLRLEYGVEVKIETPEQAAERISRQGSQEARRHV